MNNEHQKSLEDQIDWKVIDQLHAATLNFSNASLELKKMFFILVGIAVPTLIKLASNKLDLSLFITLYILTIAFFFLDSFTYFYQEKLRVKMDKCFNGIRSRNIDPLVISNNPEKDFAIESNRKKGNRAWHSMYNSSVMFYYAIFALNTIGFVLFELGFIQ